MRITSSFGGILLATYSYSSIAYGQAFEGGDTLLLDEIVISANRTESLAARTGADVTVLTEQDFAQDGRPFVLDYLDEVPGLSTQQSGPAGTVSGFTLRGAPQQYVRVLVDGIEISDPTGPQVASSLSGLMIDDVSRVEVLKGSQSALYGGQAVGGVIDITSPRPTEYGIESRYLLEGGTHDTFRGSYTLAGRLDRGDFALSINRFQSDGFSAAEEADGNSEADSYKTTRLSASGNFIASDSVTLFGAAFYQEEDGDFDGSQPVFPYAPADAPNTFDATTWGARAGADFTGLGPIESMIALSYYKIDRSSVTIDPVWGDNTYETNGNRQKIEYIGRYPVSDALAVQFGADYTREATEVAGAGTESNWITGIFAQADYSPIEALTLNAALRGDRQSEFGNYPTGRLTAAYALPSDTILRANLGSGFRAPSNYELFDPLYGNRDLDPETSQSADLGVEQAFGAGRGSASATVFWLRINDLIDYDYTTSRYVQSDGNSDSSGLELAAAWDLSEAMTVSGAYTYTDAQTATGARRDRVPRHDLSLRLDGSLTDRVDFGLGAQYIGDYYDGTGPQDSEGFAEYYWLANARLAYDVTEDAQVYVRAENLFDTQYQTVRGYSTAGQTFYFGVTGTF